jgi:hypothetical protein
MLLTLVARSLGRRITATGRGEGELTVFDLPDFAIRQFALRGVNLPASMLAGLSLTELDRLRDRADKALCPCLVLIEDTPLSFVDPDAVKRGAAADRVRRLATAAHRLGCNALAISFEAPDTDEAFELVADEVKQIMPYIERMELNVLLAPRAGLTSAPERLTDLIKRIGGFRIGSLPSFGHAAETGDLEGTLRKLAPYAGAVHATIRGFTSGGKHKDYDLLKCVAAIRSVGFVNTLGIDYVGSGDPIENIERARDILSGAIATEE